MELFSVLMLHKFEEKLLCMERSKCYYCLCCFLQSSKTKCNNGNDGYCLEALCSWSGKCAYSIITTNNTLTFLSSGPLITSTLHVGLCRVNRADHQRYWYYWKYPSDSAWYIKYSLSNVFTLAVRLQYHLFSELNAPVVRIKIKFL